MYNKNPPFEITNAILDEIAEIAELVGQVIRTNPVLIIFIGNADEGIEPLPPFHLPQTDTADAHIHAPKNFVGISIPIFNRDLHGVQENEGCIALDISLAVKI